MARGWTRRAAIAAGATGLATPVLAMTTRSVDLEEADAPDAILKAFEPRDLAPRRRRRLTNGWSFALGHADDPARDFGYGRWLDLEAKQGQFTTLDDPAALDPTRWSAITVPHDWAVSLPFVHDPGFVAKQPADGNPFGYKPDLWDRAAEHGYKPLGRGFPATSIGWYRLELPPVTRDPQRRAWIEFDGAFRDTTVFLNGFRIARHESGDTPFAVAVTPFLNTDARPDVLLVRVDATQGEGWYYEGAGLYRHVWLVEAAAAHIPQFGLWARGDVNGRVAVETRVVNDSDAEMVLAVQVTLRDAAGAVVMAGQKALAVPAAGEAVARHALSIGAPRLWSIDDPHVYEVEATVLRDGAVIDRLAVPLGLKDARFDADRGFFLNGKPLKLHGVALHFDHAGVGNAVPDAVLLHRMRKLKEMGANAIRPAHGPAAPELGIACDRLGLLLFDETRVMSASAMALDRLRTLVLRDRNHPSLFLWSLGNEEPAAATPRGATLARAMKRVVNALDPGRPVTVAMNDGFGGPLSDLIDVQGFNYQYDKIDAFRAAHPTKPILGSETGSVLSTRGEYARDDARQVLTSYDDEQLGFRAADWWGRYAETPWLAGGFLWSGFDYRGEPAPYNRWPGIAASFGAMDLCGFEKDIWHFYRSWWRPDDPHLHLFPHWNWAGDPRPAIPVWVYTNAEAVELWVNGRSHGRRRVPLNGHVAWDVPWTAGRIEAVAYRGGTVVARDRRVTAGDPAALALTLDRARLAGDDRDCAVARIEVRDARGVPCPRAAVPIDFRVEGAARLIGVGNGDPNSHEADKAHFRHSYNGLATAIVEAHGTGAARVTASAPGLRRSSAVLHVEDGGRAAWRS